MDGAPETSRDAPCHLASIFSPLGEFRTYRKNSV
jgi:hypothetical protein